MQDFQTPVVLILFNRPQQAQQLIARLRWIRPSRLLVIADGPRPTHPDDTQRCHAVRATLGAIDWPCTIEREFSESNLGCDRRVQSGLDWVFTRADQAIVLEDDILPHPSFFPWAAAMLERYKDHERVGLISGTNPLGQWGAACQDHLHAHRGSIWGWAGTAAAWRRIQGTNLAGDPDQAALEIARLNLDPLLTEHYTLALQAFRRGQLVAWDVIFSLRRVIAGDTAIVSSVNLVRNTGIGREATRTTFEQDFRALIPVGEARLPGAGERHELEPNYDRAALLVELMAGCHAPSMAWRMARMIGRGMTLPVDPRARHPLTPFAVAAESLTALEHLVAQGVASPLFNQLLETMREAAKAQSP